MDRVEIELFTDGGHDAIIRMPGRSFPGVVIQGDTLSTLWMSAKTALDALRQPESRAAGLAELEGLTGRLDAVLTCYERTLETHDIRPPYNLSDR